jgi:hypothetical protein
VPILPPTLDVARRIVEPVVIAVATVLPATH